MADDTFATLIFKGGRFQGAAMPLEALPELAAYRELVLAVAKAIWQRDHQERQRLPKGFERDFRLVMLGVTEGSTVPHIARAFEGQTSLIARAPDLFDSARDLVEKAIRHAAKNNDLPPDFPLEVVPRFSAFGQTLDDNDVTVLEDPLASPPEPVANAAPAVVSYVSVSSKSQVEAKGQKLARCANDRGRLFPPAIVEAKAG